MASALLLIASSPQAAQGSKEWGCSPMLFLLLLTPQGEDSLQLSPAPVWVLYELQVDICSTINLHGLQRLSLLCRHGVQGSLLWCSFPLPSLVDLSVSLTLYSKTKEVAQQVFPLLNMLLKRCFKLC